MSSKISKYLISTFLCSWIMWGLVALGGRFGITCLTFGNPIGMILYVFGGVTKEKL
ncbi:MAG: hypothetical protein K0S61_3751 [Anaerocolumna sp.]|nr:hypothetical protein [Anaerocolumna sp.]